VSYSYPLRLRLLGDRLTALKYAREGRGVVQMMMDQAQRGQRSYGRLHATNAAGVRFTATWTGGHPTLEIDATSLTPTEQVTNLFISGFVVRPRNIDNENEFGLNSHVLLSLKGDELDPAFFDATYLPVDRERIYEETTDGRELFPGGFSNGSGVTQAGNIDWRNSKESLAVSWVGAPERFKVDLTQLSRYVFCNGAVLMDAGVGNAVLAACIRPTGGAGLRLFWVTDEFDLFYADLQPDRTAIPWWPTNQGALGCPRFELVDEADKTLAAFLDGGTVWSFAFNQSATEAKGIFRSLNGDGGADIIERTYDFSDVDNVTSSDVTKGVLQLNLSTAREGENTTTGSNPLLIDTDYAASASITEEGSAFPIAVDYENDEPVRLWLKLATGASSCSYTLTRTHTEGSNSTGDIFTSQTDTSTVNDTGSSNFTSSGQLTEGELYAETEGGERWFSQTIEGSYSAQSSTTLSQDGSYVLTGTYTGDGITHSWTFVGVDTHSSMSTCTTAVSSGWNDVILWWVNLSKRSIVITNLVANNTIDRTYSRTGSMTLTQNGVNTTVLGVPVYNPNFSSSTVGEVTTTDVETEVVTYTYTTTLMFNGETVDTLEAVVSDTYVTDNSSVATTSVTISGASAVTAEVSLPVYPLLPDNSVPGTNTSVNESASATTRTSELPISVRNGVIELGISESVIDVLIGGQHDPYFFIDPVASETNLLVPLRFGSFIAYKTAWAYSMPNLQGAFEVADFEIGDWTSAVYNGDINLLTGALSPENYSTMWAICKCLYRLNTV
jgi:hypothetical protein